MDGTGSENENENENESGTESESESGSENGYVRSGEQHSPAVAVVRHGTARVPGGLCDAPKQTLGAAEEDHPSRGTLGMNFAQGV